MTPGRIAPKTGGLARSAAVATAAAYYRRENVMFAKRLVMYLVLVCLGFSVAVADGGEDVVVGRKLTLASKVFGGEREFLVHLPPDYEKSGESYPVLIQMNGGFAPFFTKTAATIDTIGGATCPPMIVVATVNDNADFFPVSPNNRPDSAKAADFLRFLTDELLPHLEKNYRTLPFRILYGRSNAGLFTVYTALSKPDTFSAYIASSPMLGWCAEYMEDLAVKSLADKENVPRWLYLIYGKTDYDRVTGTMPGFEGILRDKAPAAMRWGVKCVADEGHVPFASLFHGLRFVFPDWTYQPTSVDAGELVPMEKHYQELSRRYGFTVTPPAGVMMDLGYDLFQAGELAGARQVFERLLGTHPDTPRAPVIHYLLGVIGERQEDPEAAKRHYRRSLEIDPGFGRARERLDALEKK
jgi:predicted alpha/beta superfamily hydrolase